MIYHEQQNSYGYRRIRGELANRGQRVNHEQSTEV
ncbi:hypothetical protein [Jeotgalibacillus soli]